MGQYFVAGNHTTKQFIQPHAFGDGLKFGEFTAATHGFMLGLAWLLRRDEVTELLPPDSLLGSWAYKATFIAGDYTKEDIYHDVYENYEDISMRLIKELVKAKEMDRETLADQVRWRMMPAMSSEKEQADYRTFLGDLL